jgi:hypothetical protein
MEEFLMSGRATAMIAGAVAIEAVALALIFRRNGRAGLLPSLFANLAAGAALMLTVSAALADWGSTLIAGLLVFALAAHLIDVGLRWRR